MSRLAILGAGKLGEALLSGLLRAGRPVDDIVVVGAGRSGPRSWRSGTACEAVPAAEAAGADTLLLAVKPQDIDACSPSWRRRWAAAPGGLARGRHPDRATSSAGCRAGVAGGAGACRTPRRWWTRR